MATLKSNKNPKTSLPDDFPEQPMEEQPKKASNDIKPILKKIDSVIEMLKLSGMNGAVLRMEEIKSDLEAYKVPEPITLDEMFDDGLQASPPPPPPQSTSPDADVESNFVPPRYRGRDFYIAYKTQHNFLNGDDVILFYVDDFMADGANKYPALFKLLMETINKTSQIGYDGDKRYSEVDLHHFTKELLETGKLAFAPISDKKYSNLAFVVKNRQSVPSDATRW